MELANPPELEAESSANSQLNCAVVTPPIECDADAKASPVGIRRLLASFALPEGGPSRGRCSSPFAACHDSFKVVSLGLLGLPRKDELAMENISKAFLALV